MKAFLVVLLAAAFGTSGAFGQSDPELRVVVRIHGVAVDSVISVLGVTNPRDTLNLRAGLNDTVTVDFYAVRWPVVNGWYVEFRHSGSFDGPNKHLSFAPDDFLSGPPLPTAQSGIVTLDGASFQVGLTSLGEREDSGDGHLGTWQFQVIAAEWHAVKEVTEFRRLWQQNRNLPDGFVWPLGLNMSHLAMRIRPADGDPVTADHDGDGVVAFGDFVRFAAHFGQIRSDGATFDDAYDYDNSGDVGFPDFILLAQTFGGPPAVFRRRLTTTS